MRAWCRMIRPLQAPGVPSPHGRRRFEPHRPRIRQRYPAGGPILGDVPNLEAARHERYSVLVGATGSKSPHADNKSVAKLAVLPCQVRCSSFSLKCRKRHLGDMGSEKATSQMRTYT